MAFVWLWRSTGRAPRLTKRARTMVDFLDELPDRAAAKPYLHRPQLLVAARSLPFVASSCFPGPVNQSVRCTELLTCFKHLPIWRESRCSVSYLPAGCYVHGGLVQLFSRVTGQGPPSKPGQGPGDQGPGDADAKPSHEDMLRYGPFRDNLRIGRYKMGKNLGSGSFGVVKAGFNADTGDVVAVKIMNKLVEAYKVANCKDQLRREIFAMKKVSHPNIVQLLEVMASKSRIFLVMEILPGGDLENSIRNRPQRLTEAQARRYFQQILTAVEFCHGKGVYHRDLKPANVLLDANDNAKVADFGLGALTDTDNIMDLTGNFLLKSQVGTPIFMAPEILDYTTKTPQQIAQGDGLPGYSGAKADVFSCGVILYYLLSKQVPFTWKSSMTELQRNKLQAQYQDPWPKEIGDDARKLITSMLNPIPAKRIPVASIFKDSWFKQDYQPPDFRMIKEVAASLEEIDEAFKQPLPLDRSKLKPAKLNAFALIAGAKSFNLGGMVQGKDTAWEERRYTSKLPALEILGKIGDTMSRFGYNVQCRGYKVRLDVAPPSRKGPLCILAEVFQADDDLVIVEVRKVVGDSQEFSLFFIKFTTALEDVLQLVESTPDPEEDDAYRSDNLFH